MKLALASNNKRSPLRRQLAEAVAVRANAIRLRDTAAKDLDDFNVALSETSDIYYEALRAHEKAERDFIDAMRANAGNETRVVEHAIRDGSPHPRKLVVETKRNLDEAEENKTLGQQGLVEVGARLNIAERDSKYAEEEALKVIHSLWREALPALIKEANGIQDDLIERRAVIQHLVRSAPDMQFNQYHPDKDTLRQDATHFLQSKRLFGSDQSMVPVATAPWNASCAALLVDPDAPLPSDMGG